jgi:hypothetical protein
LGLRRFFVFLDGLNNSKARCSGKIKAATTPLLLGQWLFRQYVRIVLVV